MFLKSKNKTDNKDRLLLQVLMATLLHILSALQCDKQKLKLFQCANYAKLVFTPDEKTWECYWN